MRRSILPFVWVVFCMASFVFTCQNAEANEIEIKRDGLYAGNIPDGVFQSVEEYADDILVDSILEHKKEGGFEDLEIGKDSEFLICKPYVVWSIEMGKGENTAAEYHFPIVCDGKVIAEVEALKGIGDYTPGAGTGCSIDSLWAEKLNEQDYLHKDYIFYDYQGYTYAENAEKSIQADLYSHAHLYKDVGGVEARKLEEDAFFALSYAEKVQKILQDLDHETERFFGTQLMESPDAAVKKQVDNAENTLYRYLLYAGMGAGVVIVVLSFWRLQKKHRE